jgi:hypothetical protein
MTEKQIDELIFMLQQIAGSLHEINENIERIVVYSDVQPEFYVPTKSATKGNEE